MAFRIFLVALCSVGVFSVTGQSRQPRKSKPVILVEVNKKPVTADEFLYLYKKNHNGTAYTKEDALEYLDLFVRFKLKVEEALARGLDTTAAFRTEYAGYRNELLKPYLPDAKLVDSLVDLTYDRLKMEVRASHILINVATAATPADTAEAYTRVMDIRKRVLAGEDFGKLAEEYSDDPSAKTNHGDLGYFTALQMVFPFENAAYTTPIGEISMPVRTRFGYHLILVKDRRPARGEVEVSHIMINTAGKKPGAAREQIFALHDQLAAGADWGDICKQYSEDQRSKDSGGRLRPFGVAAMASVPAFEAAAFSLQQPGEISDPVQTQYGWHILRLERKIPLPTLEVMRDQLKTRVARDERLIVSKRVWQEKLRREFHLTENQEAKATAIAWADSLSAKPNQSLPADPSATLITLDGHQYTIADFVQRVKARTGLTGQQSYDNYVDALVLDLLEEKIVREHPDFALLTKEYYEGILLFEIMEDEVWNKASQDSVGQHKYFDENSAKYTVGERAEATFYSAGDSTYRAALKRALLDHDSLRIASVCLEHDVQAEQGVFEKKDRPFMDNIRWSPGVSSFEQQGMYYLAWIEKIRSPGQATFEEARADVLADYQEAVEDAWVARLRKKYPVKIHEKGKKYVLERLNE